MFAPGMSEPVCSLLERMLEPDPRKRYTVEQVRSHPWYTQQRGRPPQRAQAVAEENCGRRHSRTTTTIGHGVDVRGYPSDLVSIPSGALEVAADGIGRRSKRVDPARISPSVLPSGQSETGPACEQQRRSRKRCSRSLGLRPAMAMVSASDFPDGDAGCTADSSISNSFKSMTILSCGGGSSSEGVGGGGSWCDVPDGKDISSAESEGVEILALPRPAVPRREEPRADEDE